MTETQEEQLKSKMIQQIVGSVRFSEIVKVLHTIATKEVDFQLSQYTSEEKQEIYEELFQSSKDDGQNLQELSGQETPAE